MTAVDSALRRHHTAHMRLGERGPGHLASVLSPRSEGQEDLVSRARAVIPGGTLNSAVMPAGLEFVVERGKGPWIIDVDGRRFLDFVLGGGPLVLGHAHPLLVETITRAAAAGTQHYAMHRRTTELAERIVRLVPCAEMVRFTGSGSEATFHALRLARAVTGRQGIVKFDGGYHGHHDLVTWSFQDTVSEPPVPAPESSGIQRGVADDVVVVPFNDAETVDRVLREEPDRFAAVIVEPFQRAICPEPGFLAGLRAACDRTGTVLVFDEVVTGFRFAPGGAQGRYDVTPDLTTLGKALAGGTPLSALVGRRSLMRHLDPTATDLDRSFHCGTFNGNLLAVECAHTTLDIMVDGGGIARLEEMGNLAGEALRAAFRDAGIPVHVVAEGGIFQPYFTDGKIRTAADIRASDLARAAAFNTLLLGAGIYKIPGKGYVSIVHDEGAIDELGEAARWALAQMSAT